MHDVIDFNAGEIIEGKKSLEETAHELLDLIIDVASGRLITKAELNKQEDFIPWKKGVSL